MFRKEAVFIAALVILIVGPTSIAQAQVKTISLQDFGAVGDGVNDDGPALQRALNALADAGGGTLFVPAGHFAIVTPVSKDFSGLASSIIIMGVESSTPVDNTGNGQELSRGLDLVSEFFPRTGDDQIAIAISGLQNLLVRDIGFVGTPNVETDALITLYLERVEESTIRHCEFYGLSSLPSGGAIVTSVRSRLKIEQSKFLGSTGNSGTNVPVVENYEWKGIAVTDSAFVDYGQRPELWGKLGNGPPYSWINIGNATATTNDSPRREAVIRNVFLDEGGLMGISSTPDRYQQVSVPIDLVYISGLRINVSNLAAFGNYFSSLTAVLIENSRYEYSHNADSAVYLVNVREAVLDQLQCLDGANRIRADAATGSVSVINSVYTYLNSEAPITKVIKTQPEDDPVQYVRRQYVSALGREPDAAGHYYWTDLILGCGEDTQCIANTQALLRAYLGSAPSPNFSITGQVTAGEGVSVPGVSVTLSGSQNVTTQTDANGNYSFSNLPTSGVYSVSLAKTHYTFNNPSASFTTPSADQRANFTGTLNRHTIGGSLADGAAQPVAGAVMTLSGSQDATTTTDALGHYSFADLRAGGTYTVTPSKSSYHFSPQAWTIEDLSADSTAQFTLVTYSIGGHVSRADGTALAAVTVTLNGASSQVATTNAEGDYSFSNLPAGLDYSVTLSRLHYTFAPPGITYDDLGVDQTASFTGIPVTYSISGRATVNTAALPGVLMTLSGSRNGTATTDANGYYSFPVPAEGTYTVTPSLDHYTFTPSEKSFASVTANSTAHFAALQSQHVIRGRVSNSNNYGLAGVSVALSGSQNATVMTDANGNFSFTGLAGGGSYTVTPTLRFHSFNIPNYSFNDLSSDQYVEFTAIQNYHTISGTVRANGVGIYGVNVSLSGAQTATTTTDAAGHYTFGNLLAGDDYSVSVLKTNYAFSPAARAINDIEADQSADFTGGLVNYQLSGRAIANGRPLRGVKVTLGGSQTATTTTDADGNYSFSLQAEGNYTITPSRANYTFVPTNISFNNLSANHVDVFVAQLTPGVPVLVSSPNSTRALALDSVLHTAEPFQLTYDYAWSQDRRTRIMLFATNFELSSNETATAVTAEAQDASGRIYNLSVEYVGKTPGLSWANCIVVRLHDDLGDVGDVLVRITYHGISSNRVRVGIGHVGGGPADDAGAVPTPGYGP